MTGGGLRRGLAILGALVLAVVIVAPLVSADVRFLSRATYEEARILLKRRSLDRLIADTNRPAAERAAFQLVLDARRFAADSLGLRTKQTFAAYADVGHDTLVLVISASPKNSLTEYRWHFPVVGAVPYKGFFDFAAAAREANGLESQGYDTYTRPAPAFSTLGWFDDPLLSTAMTRDRVSLVSMVLHELTHSTWYVPSQTPFDESLAEFAGWRGAERFFRARGDTVGAARAAAIWRDERRLEIHYARLSGNLQALYARALTGSALDSGRAAVFEAYRSSLSGSGAEKFEVYSVVGLTRSRLNNASLIAERIYRDRLHVFDQVLNAYGGDLPAALKAIGGAVKTDAGRRDPYRAVSALAADAVSRHPR